MMKVCDNCKFKVDDLDFAGLYHGEKCSKKDPGFSPMKTGKHVCKKWKYNV